MTNDEIYELAANSVRRKQFKKAINYFIKILKKDPEYIEARRGLRAVEINSVEPGKIPVVITSMHLFIKLKLLVAKKKYDEALMQCEEIFKKDPANLTAVKTMLKCAEEMEYPNTLQFAHESLAELCSDDAGVIIDAADFLSDLATPEGYEKASKLMEELVSLDPTNTDLVSEQSRIEAKKSINTIEKSKSATDVLANKDQAKELEAESQTIRSDDDLEAAIERAIQRDKDEPNNSRHKETIANLLYRKKDFQGAIEYFEAALEIDPNNQNAHSRLSETKIRVMEIKISSMQKRKKKLDGDDLKDIVKRIKATKKKLLDMRHQEYNRRLKVNPNNAEARYSLGELFYSIKSYDKAIQQFQRSATDANLSFKSCEYLGHCFKIKGLYDMAINEYNNAYEKPGVKTNDQLNVLNEIGNCYVEVEKIPEALDIFKKILKIDFGYKDIASKVEELQK